MSKTVTVILTVPQAEELWSAARYKADQEPDGDGLDSRRSRVLENAIAKLDAAMKAAAR